MSNSASTKLSRLLTTAKVRTKKKRMNFCHTLPTQFPTFPTRIPTFSDSHVPFFFQRKHLFHSFPEHITPLQSSFICSVLSPFIHMIFHVRVPSYCGIYRSFSYFDTILSQSALKGCHIVSNLKQIPAHTERNSIRRLRSHIR